MRFPRTSILLAIIELAVMSQAFGVGDGNDLIPDIQEGSVQVRLEFVVDVGSDPVTAIKGSGDNSKRLFIVQSHGVIQIYADDALLPTPFLNAPASPSGRAMSGLAFHPDFPSNPRFFVVTGEALPNSSVPHYLPPQDNDGTAFDNMLVEYQLDDLDANVADPSTRREMLRVRQPFISHNMNDITFGGDGYLYIAMGDGGNTRTGTPAHYNTNAQMTTNPYGAILRVDVDTLGSNGRYGIPSNNPFADGADGNVPEIFAWGVRNPWRISTDRNTGLIYTGVNGDFTIEWVLRVELAKNYGWDSKEGSFLWNPLTGEASVDPSPNPEFTAPIGEYDHNNSLQAFGSIIGGFVYRGSDIPELYGRYLFHDWVAAKMISMNLTTGEMELVIIDPGGASLIASSLSLSEITWGEDDDGELYMGRANGEVLLVRRSLPDVYVQFAASVNGIGTQVSPFDNAGDAVEDVATGGVVHLMPGDSPEVFTGSRAIARQMTLSNEDPGSGPVRIGAENSGRSFEGFVSQSRKPEEEKIH